MVPDFMISRDEVIKIIERENLLPGSKNIARTLQFYARQGVLDRPERTSFGRDTGVKSYYPKFAITQLRMIKEGKGQGLTLGEIRSEIEKQRERRKT